MPVPFANGSKYLLTFIDDYTRMWWVYLLKEKSHKFLQLLRIFIYGLQMKLNLILALFNKIMVANTHLMNLENTYKIMVLNIKPPFLIHHNKMVWKNA